jgi:hypothetical protein
MEHSMPASWWLLFATALLSIWNAGIVWFVQIGVYPLWPFVGPKEFQTYHLRWWRYMQPAFGPVVLMFLCSVALLFLRPQGILTEFLWLGIALQIGVHSLTVTYWAPIQAALATPEGMSHQKYKQLMGTHWWRVGFFAAHALLMVWMVSRSLASMM